jgi:hypothetical protein
MYNSKAMIGDFQADLGGNGARTWEFRTQNIGPDKSLPQGVKGSIKKNLCSGLWTTNNKNNFICRRFFLFFLKNFFCLFSQL